MENSDLARRVLRRIIDKTAGDRRYVLYHAKADEMFLRDVLGELSDLVKGNVHNDAQVWADFTAQQPNQEGKKYRGEIVLGTNQGKPVITITKLLGPDKVGELQKSFMPTVTSSKFAAWLMDELGY